MRYNGTHERHVATWDWVKIHGRWTRDKGNPKVANKDWPCGNERTSPLDPILAKLVGRREGEGGEQTEGERDFRVRSSHSSLDFLIIGPSNLGETRGKVDPQCKSYTWVPVLWSFNNFGR